MQYLIGKRWQKAGLMMGFGLHSRTQHFHTQISDTDTHTSVVVLRQSRELISAGVGGIS